MNPEVQQAINNINAYIVENHNNEITANVLNPILIELATLFDLVGDLSELNTTDKDSVVDAINEAISLITTGAQIHTGTADPNVTPPAAYAVGDLYSRLTIGGGDPYQIYMFNGVEWGEIKRFINDAITSEEYSWSSQKIADAILGDRLLNSPTIVLDENDITISDLQWVINGNTYILSPAFTETIPYTSEAGKVRTDIIVAIQANELLRIQGVEGDVAIAPNLPENTVLVTTVDVFHDSLGDVEPPIVGEQYVKKMGYQYINKTSGSPGTLAYPLAEDKRNYVILNWNAPETIAGFTFGGDTIYNGMIVTIDNQSAHTPTLLDQTNVDALADVTFDFRAGISEYTMKPGEFLTFKLRGSVLVFVSTNQAETDVEVPTKTSDLINDGADGTSTYVEFSDVGAADGVVPLNSSQKIDSLYLPSYVDDVLEFADLASFPVTGESGKIYIALDTNFTYRWSGSAYVRVNEGVVLGETSTTAYRGDRGKTAYDHSQETGNPHQTTLQQVVDTDGTVTDKPVEFKSATPDTSTVNINNERVRVENQTDGKAVEIRVNNLAFEQAGKKISIEPASIDDDYVVTVQAKNHTVAGLDDVENATTAIQRTGTVIAFDRSAVYCTPTTPCTGNITYDFTDAKFDMVQTMFHEDTIVPTFGVGQVISGEYEVELLNVITFRRLSNSEVLIKIQQITV